MLRMRTLPTGPIEPCLPTKTDALPSGGLWVHEIKHDGFRIIARKNGVQVRLYSRPGNDLTGRFPLIVETLVNLRTRSCIIDGEAVACDDNGLLVFDRLPRQQVKFSRGNIYLRDQNRCQYCWKKFSSSELSLDHVVPISRGGKSTWENVVCACLPCNVRKGNKLLSECEMRLRRHPARPKWHPLHRLQGRTYPEIWKNFLDEAYWNVELRS